jgi:predicted metalloprotease
MSEPTEYGLAVVRFDEAAKQDGKKYVEDRRGQRGPGGSARASSGGLPIGKGGLGGLIIALLVALLGGGSMLGGAATSSPALEVAPPLGSGQAADANDEEVLYIGALMADIQDTWDIKFQEAGREYEYTKIVPFEGSVATGCGNATSAVGPFYCPAPGDNKVYLDLGFWDDLATKFGAPGDFAQAYVIAHEVGHHIQSVTGISDSVRQIQAQNPGAKNELSVRQELQADCLAGVWANDASQRRNSDGTRIIETGDIEEGLNAAAGVGDDRIQQQAGMRVDPHGWTHGSSRARQFWFTEGFNTGDPERCDTFAESVSRGDIGL